MSMTFVNTTIPVASQAMVASSNYKNATNADSAQSKNFSKLLSSSVKAKETNDTSSSDSASSDTNVYQSDLRSQGSDQEITKSSPTEQSDVVTKEMPSAVLASNEPNADDKKTQATDTTDTTDTTPLVTSSALLMMLLQMNTLATAVNAPVSPLATTAQPGELTTSINDVNTQTAVLQPATASTKVAIPPVTTDFATLFSTMADNGSSLTSGQLTKALKQLTENSSVTPVVPTLKGDSVLTDSSLLGDTQSSLSVGQDSPVSVARALKQSSLVTADKQVTQGNAIQLQASLVANVAASQSQAEVTDNQRQDLNPVLAALQTQLASKFTVDRQGLVLNAKGGVKTVDSAQTDSSSLVSPVAEILDNDETVTMTAPKENNTLLGDMKQLTKPSDDGPSSNLSDTTLGNFAQALSSEQSHLSTTAVSENVPQQQSASKDSFQVMHQIVDQAKLITRAQNTEMVIQLKPEHLGELTLKVTVDHGLVNATFHSNNSEVRSVIEASLPQLKQDLANSGLKVDNVGVYTGLDQSTSNQQNQSQHQPQLKFVRKGDVDNFDDVAKLVAENQLTATDGVDYRI